ncbi:MAG: OmpA family protein [Bacteroidetes bacterium]|nr:OmpA family protein [Bacteroidota bacterium]
MKKIFPSFFCFNLVLLVLFTPLVYAQKKFSSDADKSFKSGEYYTAIMHYKKAYAKERSNAEKARIIFQIAECYRLVNDPKSSEVWYTKAIQIKYHDPVAWFYLADAKKANGKYDEALADFNKYKELKPDDPRGSDGAKSCELAQNWIDNPSRYQVENVVLINSPQSDFAPAYSKKDYKTIIFTSAREGTLGDATDGTTGQRFTDLFEVKLDRKGKWSTPTLVPEPLNSEVNEGAVTFDSKFKAIYFTRCPIEGGKIGGCQIYTAAPKGNDWASPEKISLGPDSNTIGHPSLSADATELYFASDMAGGLGGRDIWVSKWDKKEKKWGDAQNLGTVINTPGDEVYPFMHENGTLYFSSNYHIGMGGTDIFKSKRKSDKWDPVENLGYPMNSEGDDFSIIFEGLADRGYLTSNRKGGKGNDDIYFFFSPELVFTLQGVVIDAETRALITGATVTLIGSDGTSKETQTDEVGSYYYQLSANTSYEITASKPKYLSDKGTESTIGLTVSKDLVHDFELKSIRKPIELPNIYYDLDKWTLRPESKEALDGLIKTLTDNPTTVIKINSHTDSRADDKYNIELSQKRAQSVVDYLIENGIDAERLTAQGYGESKPQIPDRDINKLKTEEEREAAHQKNRRTEFEVLRTDYVPKTKTSPMGNKITEPKPDAMKDSVQNKQPLISPPDKTENNNKKEPDNKSENKEEKKSKPDGKEEGNIKAPDKK